MLKRLVAILFVFVIAGQVSAGVCGCLGDADQPQHSCCKRQKAAGDALRQKGCCDAECAISQSEKLPQERTNAAVKLSLKAVAKPAVSRLESFGPIESLAFSQVVARVDHRLKYSRPPELYLRHHAFLI